MPSICLAGQGITLLEDVAYQEERPLTEVANDLLLRLRADLPTTGIDDLNSGEDGRLSQNGQCCPNEGCELYGRVDAAQVIRFGKTKSGTQRYRCLSCGQTFTETLGTIFYRKQAPRETIMETLALLARGARISQIARIKGVKDETILDWLKAAFGQTEAIEEALRRDYQISQAQLDRMWAYVRRESRQEAMLSGQAQT